MDAIVGGLSKPAANMVAKKTIGSVFELLAKKYELVDILKFKNNYLEYCDKILEVKTLVSQDRIYHIDELFVPVHLVQPGSSAKFEINDNTALDNDRALLIKGLAGQGKSTLLRKLLSNNAKRFSRLPIFYELKNYKGGKIELSIAASLDDSGVKLGPYALNRLLLDSNVKVYLDAFDEVKP